MKKNSLLVMGLVLFAWVGSIAAHVEHKKIYGNTARTLYTALPAALGVCSAYFFSNSGYKTQAMSLGLGFAGSAIMHQVIQKSSPQEVYKYAQREFEKLSYAAFSDENLESIRADLVTLMLLFGDLSDYEYSERFPISCQKYSADIKVLLTKVEEFLTAFKLTRAAKLLDKIVRDPLLGDFGNVSLEFKSDRERSSFICRKLGAMFAQASYPLIAAEKHLREIALSLKTLKREFSEIVRAQPFGTFEEMQGYSLKIEELFQIVNERIELIQSDALYQMERSRLQAEQDAREVERLTQERLAYERRKEQERRLQAQHEYDVIQRQNAEERAQRVLVEQLKIEREIAEANAQKTRKDCEQISSAEERAQRVLAEQLAIQKQIDDRRAQEAQDKILAEQLQARYDRNALEEAELRVIKEGNVAVNRREKEAVKMVEKSAEDRAKQVLAEQLAIQKQIDDRCAQEALDKKLAEQLQAQYDREFAVYKEEIVPGVLLPEAPECPICLESLATGDIAVLDCNNKIKHAFHADCVRLQNICPNCRKEKTLYKSHATWNEVATEIKAGKISLPS